MFFFCSTPADWWDKAAKCQEVVRKAAKEIFDAQTAEKYFTSVTETEIKVLLKICIIKIYSLQP